MPSVCAQNGAMIGFNATEILRFYDLVMQFGLKLPIHAHFGEFWGIFPPNGVTLHTGRSPVGRSKIASVARVVFVLYMLGRAS